MNLCLISLTFINVFVRNYNLFLNLAQLVKIRVLVSLWIIVIFKNIRVFYNFFIIFICTKIEQNETVEIWLNSCINSYSYQKKVGHSSPTQHLTKSVQANSRILPRRIDVNTSERIHLIRGSDVYLYISRKSCLYIGAP